MLLKASGSLPVPLAEYSVYKCVPPKVHWKSPRCLIYSEPCHLWIRNTLKLPSNIEESQHISSLHPKWPFTIITLNILWKELKNWSRAEMSEGGLEMVCCGGEVTRGHGWDIEPISCMFNTHVNDESIWDEGLLQKGHMELETEHGYERRNYRMSIFAACVLSIEVFQCTCMDLRCILPMTACSSVLVGCTNKRFLFLSSVLWSIFLPMKGLCVFSSAHFSISWQSSFILMPPSARQK